MQLTENVMRYDWIGRWTHTFHAIAMLVLIFTGLVIYFRWDIMSMHNARTLHMVSVPVLILTNWFLVPYGIIVQGYAEGGVKGIITHFYNNYIFNSRDAKHLSQAIKNFFGKGEYPKFTIYDKGKGHYITRLHPLFKIFIVLEGISIFLIFLTGIVLYDVNWSIFGLPIAQWITTIFGWFAPFLNLSSLSFIRWVHLALTYFFIFELICHALILQFAPKPFNYWKTIFITGKEDFNNPVVQVIDSSKDEA